MNKWVLRSWLFNSSRRQSRLSLWSFSFCSCFYFSSNTALHVCFILGQVNYWLFSIHSVFSSNFMSLHTLFLCSLPHLLVFKSYARFFRVDATSHTHFRSLFPGEMNPKGLWTQRRRVGLEEDCTELTWIEIEDKVKVHILGESTSPPLAPFLPSAPQTLANSCLTLKKKPGRFLPGQRHEL